MPLLLSKDCLISVQGYLDRVSHKPCITSKQLKVFSDDVELKNPVKLACLRESATNSAIFAPAAAFTPFLEESESKTGKRSLFCKSTASKLSFETTESLL